MARRATLPIAIVILLAACGQQKYALQPEKPGMVARARCAAENALGINCRQEKVHPALVSAAANWSNTETRLSGEAAMHAEAARVGRPVPKAALEVLAYRTDAEVRNGEVVVNADILLFGRSPRAPEVVHTMTLVAANGEVASAAPQLARLETVDGAGHYRTVSRYPLPPGTEAGVYTIRTTLLIGGAEAASRQTHFQVRP
jgi:hypothetical protein